MSNLGGTCLLIVALLVVSVISFPQPNSLRLWDRNCCAVNDGACNGADQYWYLYVPSDLQFNCEDLIQNPNRFDFYDNTLNSPGSTVHPDFSGYAWEINGCHIAPTVAGVCESTITNDWCSLDDTPLDLCDDDDDGGGVNTWMRVWSDAITRHDNDQCPYQFTITRTWSSQTSCRDTGVPRRNTQLIYVVDQLAPNLEIPADLTIECPSNFVPDYTLGQASAIDQCTTTEVQYTNVLTPTRAGCNAGTVTRTFTANDRCGNSVTKVQTVTVVDTTPPIIPQLPAVTTDCQNTAPATTGSPGNVPYYRCEQHVKSGPVYLDFTAGTCSQSGNVFGCNQITAGVGNRDFLLTAPIGNFITLEFNDLRIENRGTITVYDGSSSAAPPLIVISSPVPSSTPPTPQPADNPGPITGSGNNLFVRFTPTTIGDTTVIDGFTGFWYSHKNVADLTATPTFADATIPGPCQGTYTVLRTWYATDECANQGTMTQTIFVVDNVPPGITPPFPTQTNIVEQVDCLSDFVSFNPTPVDTCSQQGATITKQVTLGGASGQNFAFAIVQTFTATDGCDNTISWSYTQEIGYYPVYLSGVLPPYITGQAKAAPFVLSVGVAETADALNYIEGGGPTFCTSPIVLVADAGPALLSAGSDPCWTQAAGGLLYCETTTIVTPYVFPIDLVLTVPADYAPNSLIISFTIAERALIDISVVPLIGFLFGADATSDNVVITFA